LELKTVYFEHPGSETTDAVLNIARSRAQELGIKNIVGFKVIVVTHVAGMREPNVQEFTEKNRQLVEAAGGIMLTAAHAFSGLSGAMRLKFNTYVIGDIVASTLRIFGQGLKVACEISLMAADSGLVRTDEDVIAIGGTGHGADTALVLRPATSRNFFELRVKEILCKPHR